MDPPRNLKEGTLYVRPLYRTLLEVPKTTIPYSFHQEYIIERVTVSVVATTVYIVYKALRETLTVNHDIPHS